MELINREGTPSVVTPQWNELKDIDLEDDVNEWDITKAAYNSNTVVAGTINHFGKDPGLIYSDDDVADEKAAGYKFRWGNDDVQEYLKDVPLEVQEQLNPNISSMTQLVATVNRVQKIHDNHRYLDEEYGTAGSMALQLSTGIFDWDTLLPVGLIGKTKKALDLAKMSSTAARTTAFAVTGGIQSLAADAVYQQVQGTDIASQRLMSFIGGSVLTGAASSFMRHPDPSKVDTTIDGVYGPKELTIEQKAQLEVDGSSLVLRKSKEELAEIEAQLKVIHDRLGIQDAKSGIKAKANLKDGQVRAKKHTLALTKEASALEAKILNERKVQKQAAYAEAKAKHTKAIENLKAHTTSKKVIVAEQHKLKSVVSDLEAKQSKANESKTALAPLKKKERNLKAAIKRSTKAGNKAKLKLQEDALKAVTKSISSITKAKPFTAGDVKRLAKAKQTMADNGKMLKNSESEELRLHNEVTTAERITKRQYTNTRAKSTGVNVDKLTARLDKVKTTIAKNTKEIEYAKRTQERLYKLEKAVADKHKKHKVIVTSAQAKMDKALEELETTAARKLDDIDSKSHLELNWLEKKLIWTPGSYLHASNNTIISRLANKLIEPYKPRKMEDGTYAPARPNAFFYKSQFSNYHRSMYVKSLQAYHKAVKKEDYQGDYKQFMIDVGSEYRSAATKALKEAHVHIDSNLRGDALTEAILKADKGVKVVYTNKLSSINEAAHAVKDYLHAYGKAGIELKATGMSKLILNGTYLSRNFDHKAIESIGKPKAIEMLTYAMRQHPANQGMTSEELIKEATRIISNTSERGALYDSLMRIDKESKHAPSSTETRTISYYEGDVLHLLNKDLNEDLLSYNYKMSGRLALKKALGVDTRAQITELYGTLSSKSGATDKDLEALDAVIDTILGTREIMRNPKTLGNTAIRMVAKSNSIIYGGGFGLTSLTEMANIIGTTGIKNTMGLHFDAINAAFKMAKGKDVPVEWINEIQAIGLIGDIIHGLHLQRMDNAESISSSTKLEGMLDFGSHFVHKISGLQHTTEAQRAITIGAGFNDIVQMAKKMTLGKADSKRLAAYGLTHEDLKSIQHLVDTGVVKYDNKGHLKAFGFDKWSEELQEKVQFGLYSHMNNTVLNPNGATLPMFLTNNDFMGKIMFQFLRFPAAAHEKLLMRGMSLGDARQLTGVISSLALFTMVAKTKDYLKGTDRFDLDTEEGRANLVGYLSANNYMTASFMTITDLITSLATGKAAWSEHSSGVGSMLGVTSATVSGLQGGLRKMMSGDISGGIDTMQTPAEHAVIIQLLTRVLTGDDTAKAPTITSGAPGTRENPKEDIRETRALPMRVDGLRDLKEAGI